MTRLLTFLTAIVVAIILALGAGATVGAAGLQTKLASPLTCTTANCGALYIDGFDDVDPFPATIPNTGQVWFEQGDCGRLHITSPAANMRIALVAPDASSTYTSGNIFFINGIPQTGWWTWVVSIPGAAGPPTKFRLRYARYVVNNNNCNQGAPS